MALTITSYFILALLSILIVVFMGRSSIKSTLDAYDASVEEKLFVYGFTGLTIVVLVASLIKTGGQTIHIILVVFAFLIAIANKQSIRFRLKSGLLLPNKKNVSKGLFVISSLLIFVVTLSVIQFVSFQEVELLIPNQDILYYASLSETLWETGIENNYFYGSELTEQLSDMVPYHYFIEWFNSLIYGLFGTNPTLSYLLITVPAFAVVVIAGFMAIAHKLNPNAKSYQILLIGISGVLVQTYFPIDLLDSVDYQYARLLAYNPMEHGMYFKSLPIYLVILMTALLYLKNHKLEALLALCLLPAINISTFPSIALTIPSLIFSALIFKKINWKTSVKWIISSGILLISIPITYVVFGNSISSELLSNNGIGFADYLKQSSYRADWFYLMKNISVSTLLVYSVPIVFILGLRIFLKSRINRKILKIISIAGMVWLFGLLSWVTLRFLGQDSYQFFVLASVACFNTTIWLICVNWFSSDSLPVRLLTSLFLLLLSTLTITQLITSETVSTKQYSASYIAEAQRINEDLNNPVKVVSLSRNTYERSASSRDPFFSSTLCGAYWYMLDGKDEIYSLDALTTKPKSYVGKLHEEKLLKLAPISILSQELLHSGNSLNTKIQFIDRINARLYMYEKGVEIDEEVRNRIIETITDPVSGETLAIISEK